MKMISIFFLILMTFSANTVFSQENPEGAVNPENVQAQEAPPVVQEPPPPPPPAPPPPAAPQADGSQPAPPPSQETPPAPPARSDSKPIDSNDQRYLELSRARKGVEVLAEIDREIALYFINNVVSDRDELLTQWVDLRELRCDAERERCVNPVAWAKITCRLNFEGKSYRQKEILKLWRSAVARARGPNEMAKIWTSLRACSAQYSRSQGLVVMDVQSQIEGKSEYAAVSKEMKVWRNKNVKPSVLKNKSSLEVEWWRDAVLEVRRRKPVSMEKLESLVETSSFLQGKIKFSTLDDGLVFNWIFDLISAMDDLGQSHAAVSLVDGLGTEYTSQILKGRHLGIAWEYCLSIFLINDQAKCPKFLDEYYKDQSAEDFTRMRTLGNLIMGNLKPVEVKLKELMSAQRSFNRDILLQNAHLQYRLGNLDDALKTIDTVMTMRKNETQIMDQAYVILSPSLLKIKVLNRAGKFAEADKELEKLRRNLAEIVTGPFWGFAAVEFEGLLGALYEKDKEKIEKSLILLREAARTPDGKHYYGPVISLIEQKLKGGDIKAEMAAVDAARGALYIHTADLRAALSAKPAPPSGK